MLFRSLFHRGLGSLQIFCPSTQVRSARSEKIDDGFVPGGRTRPLPPPRWAPRHTWRCALFRRDRKGREGLEIGPAWSRRIPWRRTARRSANGSTIRRAGCPADACFGLGMRAMVTRCCPRSRRRTGRAPVVAPQRSSQSVSSLGRICSGYSVTHRLRWTPPRMTNHHVAGIVPEPVPEPWRSSLRRMAP